MSLPLTYRMKMDDGSYKILKFLLVAWILLTASGFAAIIHINTLTFDDPNIYDAVETLTDNYKTVMPFLFVGGLLTCFIFVIEWNNRRKNPGVIV